MNKLIAEATALSKVYHRKGNAPLTVLDNLHFQISSEDKIAIVGKSGAGKSTLLHILGTLESPSHGTLKIAGESVVGWSDKKLSKFRNETLGFVFQSHYLLPEFNTLENVMMPALIHRELEKKSREKAFTLLEKVGLKDRLTHYPSQLSGGEQQRVAIARALIMNPKILLTDEMTGNLDPVTGAQVFEMVESMQKEFRMALVSVTHDLNLAKKYSRIFELQSGVLQER